MFFFVWNLNFPFDWNSQKKRRKIRIERQQAEEKRDNADGYFHHRTTYVFFLFFFWLNSSVNGMNAWYNIPSTIRRASTISHYRREWVCIKKCVQININPIKIKYSQLLVHAHTHAHTSPPERSSSFIFIYRYIFISFIVFFLSHFPPTLWSFYYMSVNYLDYTIWTCANCEMTYERIEECRKYFFSLLWVYLI